MLFVGQDVPVETRPCGWRRQATSGRGKGVSSEGRGRHRAFGRLPSRLRGRFGLRHCGGFLETRKVRRRSMGYPRRPFLLHQLEAFLGYFHAADRVNLVPDRLGCPVHRRRLGKRDMTLSRDVLDHVGPEAEHVGIHEAGKLRVALFQRGQQLVAVGIGGIKPAFGHERCAGRSQDGQHQAYIALDGPASVPGNSRQGQVCRRTVRAARPRGSRPSTDSPAARR